MISLYFFFGLLVSAIYVEQCARNRKIRGEPKMSHDDIGEGFVLGIFIWPALAGSLLMEESND